MTTANKRAPEYLAPFDYDDWITRQMQRLRPALTALALAGHNRAALYCHPSKGNREGWIELVREGSAPTGATMSPVLWFQQHGGTTNAMAICHDGMRARIWDACRREPIIPTQSTKP